MLGKTLIPKIIKKGHGTGKITSSKLKQNLISLHLIISTLSKKIKSLKAVQNVSDKSTMLQKCCV